MTVGKKLLTGFGVLILLVSLMGGFSIFGLRNINNELNELYDYNLNGLEYIKEAQVQLIAMERARSNVLLSPTSLERNQHILNMEKRFSLFEESMKSFSEVTFLPEMKQRVSEALKLWQEVKVKEEEVISLVENGSIERAKTIARESRQIVDKIEAETDILAQSTHDLAYDTDQESDRTFIQISIILGALILFSIVTPIGVTLYMIRIISKPISEMEKAASKIAEGDLTVEAIHIRNKDEIGALAASFNTMADGLRTLISSISSSASAIASSSEELSASAQESALTSEEVARAISEIARGSGEQATDTEKATGSVIDIGNLLMQNSIYISDVSDSAQEITLRKEEGFLILRQLVEKTRQNDTAARPSMTSS